MTIVISMAGLSQRFINAGFTLPKYMLYAGNKSLFNLSVNSFSNYFKSCNFLFIARDLFDTRRFIEEECKRLGKSNYEIVILKEPTKGQAETVYLGIKNSGLSEKEPITIFNIDTFHPGFAFPDHMENWDGYLEVFWGEGANWSYAKTENETSTKVIETAEKRQISNYCSTGLYYFRRSHLFCQAYEAMNNQAEENQLKEQYVAPLYNYLIENNSDIHIHLVDRSQIQICGVPDEYDAYMRQLYK